MVATGTVEPEREVEVRPRIAGIIERILVEAGDDVEIGQLLIEIERELLESQVREAQAALRETRVERRYGPHGWVVLAVPTGDNIYAQ